MLPVNENRMRFRGHSFIKVPEMDLIASAEAAFPNRCVLDFGEWKAQRQFSLGNENSATRV